MKFSDKLQKIRKENNITQESLADRLNVSRQAVSKWESGQAYPDTEKLIQISKVFNVSLDELINDNKESIGNIDKKINFMEILNEVLEFISKSINMFWSMKFWEKIKCLFELGILFLIILGVALLSTSVISDIVRRIFMFLPSDFIYFICNLVDTLLYIAWIILGGIIIIKIFKSRYLDYYVIINDDSVKGKTVEEPILELKEKKEYKVVIRDPKDSSLNIFKKLGKIFLNLFKFLCFIVVIPLIIIFIFFVMMFVVSLFYLLDGIFFNGISIVLIGGLLFIYLMIEFIYNLMFNRCHAFRRIFILFISSITLMGIGLGLSFNGVSSFDYEDALRDNVDSHIIEMSDDLVISDIMHLDSNKIVIDDNIDYIKLDIATYEESKIYVYSYMENDYQCYDGRYGEYYCGYQDDSYKVVEIHSDYNEFDVYKRIINELKNKKITNFNYGFYEIDKVYISNDNLTTLRNNYQSYYQ